MTVAILVYEGVSAFEAMGALAALHAASIDAELVADDALVLSREGARLVPASLGLDAIGRAPAVVLPSGDLGRTLTNAKLAQALRARRGKWTLAAGDGARLPHAAGLTEGRRVSRLPGEAPLAGATSVHARLVADGRLLTCFPGDALFDLALHYAARERGDEAAAKAAASLGREYLPFAMGATDLA